MCGRRGGVDEFVELWAVRLSKYVRMRHLHQEYEGSHEDQLQFDSAEYEEVLQQAKDLQSMTNIHNTAIQSVIKSLVYEKPIKINGRWQEYKDWETWRRKFAKEEI